MYLSNRFDLILSTNRFVVVENISKTGYPNVQRKFQYQVSFTHQIVYELLLTLILIRVVSIIKVEVLLPRMDI